MTTHTAEQRHSAAVFNTMVKVWLGLGTQMTYGLGLGQDHGFGLNYYFIKVIASSSYVVPAVSLWTAELLMHIDRPGPFGGSAVRRTC